MAVHAVEPEPKPEAEESLGIDSMTAQETSMAEQKAGQSIATLGNERFPQVGLLGALGWVLHRRTDPRMTFDAYMSSRKLSDITEELHLGGDDEDEDEEGKDDEPGSST